LRRWYYAYKFWSLVPFLLLHTLTIPEVVLYTVWSRWRPRLQGYKVKINLGHTAGNRSRFLSLRNVGTRLREYAYYRGYFACPSSRYIRDMQGKKAASRRNARREQNRKTRRKRTARGRTRKSCHKGVTRPTAGVARWPAASSRSRFIIPVIIRRTTTTRIGLVTTTRIGLVSLTSIDRKL
jgi:hypothetical protein